MDHSEDEQLGDAAVDLAEQLVRLDTVNPGLVPGAAGETAAVELLSARLGAAGFACDVVPATGADDRPSLVARHGQLSDQPRKSLLLNGHLDTVGVAGMAKPFAARIVGDRRTGRLEGRGSSDMKGGVAALVVAAESIARESPDRPVTLALVADEENDSLGTEAVLTWLRERGEAPEVALVAEPTWLDLCAAHRGFAVVEVTLRGVVAHSSLPAEGVNAVTHLGRLLAAVEAYDGELRARAPHPVAGHGSLLATVAVGGSAPFSLAGSARALIERRTRPGERADDALREIQALLDRLHADDPTVDGSCRILVSRESWERDGSAAAGRLESALSAGLVAQGRPAPELVGAPYWMESAMWQEAGVPTVVCGPAGGGLHAVGEWVDLAQVRAFAVALAHSTSSPTGSPTQGSPTTAQ